jgi:hypothetical protein
MVRKRPLGVKLMAGVLFTEAAVLLASSGAAYIWPTQSHNAVASMLEHLPYFRNLEIADGGLTSSLPAIIAFVLGFWAALKGIALWLMKGWVRMLILIDLAGRFGDMFLFVGFSNPKEIMALASDPDFVIALAVNIVVLFYLFDPEVAKLFEPDDRGPRKLGAGWSVTD